jgi:hypothetical protein
MVVPGWVLSYKRGTPVAGASCFTLGLSIFILHSALIFRCLSSGHEPQVDLFGSKAVPARKFPHEGADFGHFKGPDFSTKSLLSLVELVELSRST